jgi:hypothetical protein
MLAQRARTRTKRIEIVFFIDTSSLYFLKIFVFVFISDSVSGMRRLCRRFPDARAKLT